VVSAGSVLISRLILRKVWLRAFQFAQQQGDHFGMLAQVELLLQQRA